MKRWQLKINCRRLGKSDETGVKVWMLTENNEETAINILYACSLLDISIQQVVVNATTCPDEETLRTKRNTVAREFMDNAKGMAGKLRRKSR